MKKVIPFMIVVIIYTTIAIIFIEKSIKNQKNDPILYNEIIKSVENNLENETHFEINYFVVSNEGKIKYANFNHQLFNSFDEYLNFAYVNDYKILDYSNGKIFIEKVDSNLFSNLVIILIVYSSLIVILIIIFILYLNKTIFTPFIRLKDFASEIATGNLDNQLLINKNNAFGAFTESFDIMRCELKKAKEVENALEKAKKELVVSLSHDIKTPIASIKAVAELLALTETDPQKIKKLEIIKRKTNEIDDLASNMFNITLEDLNELKLNSSLVSSKEIQQIITESDVFELVVFNNIPECLVMADILRIKQIVGNIINNSYKYAKTSIYIEAIINQDVLEIEFRDKGVGVCEEEIALLTSKFYRANNAKESNGAGLGLYICKVLLEKMNGSIECYNTSFGFAVKISLSLA